MADKVNLELSVIPKLDSRGVAQLIRDIKKLEKSMGKIGPDYQDISKQAEKSITSIGRINKDFAHLSKQLSSSAKSNLSSLESLNKELASLKSQASSTGEAYATETDEVARAMLVPKFKRIQDSIQKTVSRINEQNKALSLHGREIKRATTSFKQSKDAVEAFADFTGVDAAKGIQEGFKKLSSGSIKSGVKDIFGSIGKYGAGSHVRGTEAKSMAGGGAPGAGIGGLASTLSGLAGTFAVLAAGVSGLVAVFKLIDKASAHISGMNKALLQGSTVAGDWALSGDQYGKMLGGFRDDTIKARESLVNFGIGSEQALSSVAAYSKEASGSLSKTREQMAAIGKGDSAKGLEEMVKQSHIFGQALGMETNEVSGLMGQMVSEIGIAADNTIGTMDLIVKQAASSGIPVSKFMNIFKSVIPDIDLFTNRIEQLTGTIVVLSKSMSPRAIEGFMQAMSKGFDQMDFKQRLKMTLVLGPKKVNQALQKDFLESGKVIADQFKGAGISAAEFNEALSGKDPMDAMAAIAAKGKAAGVSGAAIQGAQELARSMAAAKKGGPLGTAAAMRGASMMARMDMLQEYAGKFTGGDLSGLGEHVAKQLGISESEYKAILALKDNQKLYSEEIIQFGKIGDKNIDDSLNNILKAEGKISDEDRKSFITNLAKNDPEKLQRYILRAGASQIASTEKEAKTADERSQELFDATTSLSDKIDNVVGYWLEKVYVSLGGVVDWLGDIFKALSDPMAAVGFRASKETLQAKIPEFSAIGSSTFKVDSDFGKKQMGVISDELSKSVRSGDIVSSMANLVGSASALSGEDFNRLGSVKLSKESLEGGARDRLRGIENLAKEGKGDEAESQFRTYLKELQGSGKESDVLSLLSGLGAALSAKNVAVAGMGIAGGVKPPTAADSKDKSSKTPDKKQNQENQKDQLKTAEEIAKSSENSAKTQDDLAKNVKSGIKLDQNFVNTKYKNVVKESTLDSFRTALVEFAILQQRLQDVGFAADFMAHAGDYAGIGGSVLSSSVVSSGDTFNKVKSFAHGGPIDYDQMANVHGGEYVVPRGGTLVKESGSGASKIVNISGVTIQVQTDADPKKIAEAVHELYRSM